MAPGIEQPLVLWIPSIAPTGMTFYTGDRFPAWKGNLFVGSARRGEIPRTGGLERVVFNDKLEELRRETLLTELHQRIRDVRQGPDGLLYVITDEDNGVAAADRANAMTERSDCSARSGVRYRAASVWFVPGFTCAPLPGHVHSHGAAAVRPAAV